MPRRGHERLRYVGYAVVTTGYVADLVAYHPPVSSFAERYGPWAIVAGASEGLGAAFVRALAARGLSVVLVARRQAVLHSLAADVETDTRIIAADLADPDTTSKIAEDVSELDVGLVVYNAAFAPIGSFDERPLDDLLRAVDVNVRAPVALTRTLVPRLVDRGRGGVVLMSSLAGQQGAPRIATYAATKAFNTVLAEGLWHELGSKGVEVVASCAGAIRTPGYEQATGREAPGTLDAAVVAERTLDRLGRGPRATPGLVNGVASFVMSRLLPRTTAVAIMASSTKELS